jgi:hypothetical protein
MQRSNHVSAFPRAALAALALGVAAAGSCLADPPAPSPVVSGVWQHRHAKFTFHGITSLYTCAALESNIRGLLLHLGARKDATVSARGCPGGSNVPSRVANVDADFYTLAPSADSKVPDAVPARWTFLEVNPQQLSFISDGDCELIDQLKDLISSNFSLKDLEYRTTCLPRKIYFNGFAIKAQGLTSAATS